MPNCLFVNFALKLSEFMFRIRNPGHLNEWCFGGGRGGGPPSRIFSSKSVNKLR